MSNSTGISKKSLDELTPEEKGKLLASIGSRRKNRPLDPITVAEILSHTPSNQELGKRLGVTSRMVGMFKSLLSLPENIKPYVRSGKISIDKAVRIASLKDNLSKGLLAEAIANEVFGSLTADIIKQVTPLKNRNEDISIEDCIKMVLKSKPIVDNRYILVTSVEKSLTEVLNLKARNQGTSFSEILKDILEQSLPNSECLLSIAVHNGTILLTLNLDGWQALRQKSHGLEVPLDELVETLARQCLYIGDSE